MLRHWLLAVIELLVLAGGVVGVIVLQPTPLLGADSCVTPELVEADGNRGVQPFGFIDLIHASWTGTDQALTATLSVVVDVPDSATEHTGPIVYRMVFDAPNDQRSLEVTLQQEGWSGTVEAADGNQILAAREIAIEPKENQLVVTAPASAFAGLPSTGIRWYASADAPEADTPASVPAHEDRCAGAWEMGDPEPEPAPTLPELPERHALSTVSAEHGHLVAPRFGSCETLAAAWAGVVDANLDALLGADDGAAASEVLESRDTVIVGRARRDPMPRDCPDMAAHAQEHLATAGQDSTFTFEVGEIADFDCDQVAAVRQEVMSFAYTSAADYVAALQVADAAERERNARRCGHPADAVTMPGASVSPLLWRGEEVGWDDIEPGDCFNALEQDDGTLHEPRRVPCALPHGYQALDSYQAESSLAPGSFEWFLDVTDDCFTDDLLARFFEDEQLEFIFVSPLHPTPEGWHHFGDRTVTCTFRDLDGFLLVGDLVAITPDASSA